MSSCGTESAAEIDLGGVGLLHLRFELTGHGAGAQLTQVRDVVVEGARRDAQQLGDRGDRAAGVRQQIASGADDFLGGDARAPAGPAALAGGGQALVGADDDEFADEIGDYLKPSGACTRCSARLSEAL
ncbi:hypothetical protein ACFVWZ_25125 [Streptomyces sp. NPDC058200]|uniref:hypothetical protein n=1 Tax=Streptomyces sp. NPDC058200 TaxID=3346378 RepID=UPI0036EF7430